MKIMNFKKVGIILGIIIVLNLFINFGVDTFYDAPEYDDFCSMEKRSQVYDTREGCENIGGFWTDNQSKYRKGESVPINAGIEPFPYEAGWCDADYTCRQNFEDANNLYRRNVFIVLVALGVSLLVAGFSISSQNILSISLTYGGLLSIIIGTIRFWSQMDDYLRFIVLGVALAALIYIAVKKFKGE